MNSYLKEIAGLCDISKCLITYTARHSYMTSAYLVSGVSIESTVKMLDHFNMKMMRHYAHMPDSSIFRGMIDMKNASSRNL